MGYPPTLPPLCSSLHSFPLPSSLLGPTFFLSPPSPVLSLLLPYPRSSLILSPLLTLIPSVPLTPSLSPLTPPHQPSQLPSPSKSIPPSLLRSMSWRISSSSPFFSFSPRRAFMLSFSSSKVMRPSPLLSNWGRGGVERRGDDDDDGRTEGSG